MNQARSRWQTCRAFASGPALLVLALLSLHVSCAPHDPGAVVRTARTEVSPLVRVVPQHEIDGKTYQGTDPSGRFAVFDGVIVDLASERVAWVRDTRDVIIPVQTADHVLLRLAQELTEGVELWDLIDGSTTLFPGALVPHISERGHVAVQRPPALDIVDTVRGTRVATIPTLGETTSVVRSDGQWKLLERTGEQGEPAQWVLASTPPVPMDGPSTLALTIPPSTFSLERPGIGQSEPFLAVAPTGELSINVLVTCPSCQGSAAKSLWTSTLDPHTGRGQPWFETPLDPAPQRHPVLPIFDPDPRGAPLPLPPNLEKKLAHLQTIPGLATVAGISPDARFAFTSTTRRSCVWSLERAERSWCDDRPLAPEQFLDATRIWVRGQHGSHPVLGIWDLTRRQTTERTFAPGAMPFPGPREQFLLYHPRQDRRTSVLEAWAFGAQTPSWSYTGCEREPYYTFQGTRVACPTLDDAHSVLLLDTSNGHVVSTRAPMPRRDRPPRPCATDTTLGSQPTIWQRGEPIVTLFDLTPTEWALVLPTGQFQGTPNAATYLAFYTSTGALLSASQVERLRVPVAVGRALGRVRRVGEGCVGGR